MTGYRCYFLGADDKIHHAEEFTSDNDDAAIERARELFTAQDFPTFELWSGGRRIHVERALAPKMP
jgi:hypothetical protein